jgi:hypothetical protein
MSNGSYLRFTHKCNIYEKTVTTNAAGQKIAGFTNVGQIQFQFQSASSSGSTGDERRLTPYQDNVPKHEGIVPLQHCGKITYGNRVQSIVDRNGTSVDDSTYEIVGLQPKFTFSGKKHHVVMTLRRVVESE